MKANVAATLTIVAFSAPAAFGFNPTFGKLTTARRSPDRLQIISRYAPEESPNAMIDAPKRGVSTIFSLGAALAISVAGTIQPVNAVSGGGLDYANLDLTGQNFSNGNYKGKDFTQIIAKGTTFENSILVGCRFYKAFLVNTNFKGADLRGASLEDTSMDGAMLDNANAAGAYFSASLLDAKSIAGADFTDAQLPPKLLARICAKENFATGTNPTTGVDTRESLLCP